MLLNNPINIYFFNPNIVYNNFLIKYSYISKILLLLIDLQSTEKKFTPLFDPVCFILSIVKSFETLPKHNGYFFIFESFALNWHIFVVVMNKKLLLLLQCRLYTNLSFDFEKLIRYLASTVTVVPSNPCIALLPRI